MLIKKINIFLNMNANERESYSDRKQDFVNMVYPKFRPRRIV